jgi:hypothetical protein
MKFVDRHPFANPDASACKIIEIANGVEASQDSRIYFERVNEPFLAAGGNGDQFRAGSSAPLRLAGYGGTRAGLTCGSPTAVRRCLPDPRIVTARAHPQRFCWNV